MLRTNTARRPESKTLAASGARLRDALIKKTGGAVHDVVELAGEVLEEINEYNFSENADLLSQACAHLFNIGESSIALTIAKQVATKAERAGDVSAHRRIANIIGIQYCDIADYASAMEYLQIAVVLARQLKSELLEAACVANVIAVLQEMGHYRQAISMVDRVLRLEDPSHTGRTLKLQCASNGLFAAHRTGDISAAAHFLASGEQYLGPDIEPLRRAFFEKNRVLYLVDVGQTTLARHGLEETNALLATCNTPRTDILLTLASATLDWASGNVEYARSALTRLYAESRRSRFYHHFVLQSLVKVYSNAQGPEDAKIGMDFARELVEYTTSVKKAKFYRQIADKRVAHDATTTSIGSTATDPFEAVKAWLTSTEVTVPADDQPEVGKRLLAKHEELTIIHEDMAKLRTLSIRRDIRTDAVDTAENWAIAAEFFDDETGQHCYRVGHLASMLAREIGMEETFCIQVEHAARLHDIGKIAVNEVILLKPGPLDASEMAAMRLHTEVGAQILSGSDDPTLRMAVDVARHHHEWWNGTGYPTKRSGRNIPISARVCAYADVYDALTHMRAYKKAWTHERAVDEIARLRGVQFDPDLFDPFIAVLGRYRADLDSLAIPGFVDMQSNALISSRKKLMETISARER